MRGTRRQPMPHQVRFLRWAKARRAVAAFMEMRLGKSMCAIRWAETRHAVDKALIVSPLSVLPSWRRELEAEGLDACEIVGSSQEERERAVIEAGRDHKWYLINKEGLLTREGGRTRPSAWVQLPWDLVIIDESTCIRNPKAKTTDVVLRHLAAAPYRAILTGLPNPEGPENYVTQMLFLEGGRPFMGSTNFWQWRQDHMQPTGFDWAVKGASLNALRQEVRARAFFMTRREAGIPDEKLRQTRWVQLPAKVLKAIKQARKEFAVGDRLTNNVLTAMQWECQLAGGRFPTLEHDAKFVELEELLAGEFKNQQVVVWARYTAELEAAVSRLEKAKIKCALVNGDVARDERERRIAAFKAGRTRVLVAQPQCLKMGVDLSEAEVAIVLSNYFDLEVRAQMEDRIVHPKKARPALIVDLVAENTIDEDVLDALTDKRREAGVFNSRLMKIARSMKA